MSTQPDLRPIDPRRSAGNDPFRAHADALERLLSGIDPDRREAASQRLLDDIEHIYRHAGMRTPAWVTHVRASSSPGGTQDDI